MEIIAPSVPLYSHVMELLHTYRTVQSKNMEAHTSNQECSLSLNLYCTVEITGTLERNTKK